MLLQWFKISSVSGNFHTVDDIGDMIENVYEGDSYNNEKRCDFDGEINPVASSCN